MVLPMAPSGRACKPRGGHKTVLAERPTDVLLRLEAQLDLPSAVPIVAVGPVAGRKVVVEQRLRRIVGEAGVLRGEPIRRYCQNPPFSTKADCDT